MELPLLFHLLALGLWIGCIATETVFEHTLGKQAGFQPQIARLHVQVDLWIEVPAFLAVLATGVWLLAGTEPAALFLAKIFAGGAAIAVNVFCVWIVLARDGAFRGGDIARAGRLDHWQHKAGALQVLLIVAALALAGIAA